MGHPWNNPRHKSWASDTVVTAVLFVIILITTVVVDILNGPADPPAYLTGLLGAASLALFGAAGSDRNKRDQEISEKADRAERRTLTLNEDILRTEGKADALGRLAKEQNPDAEIAPPLAEGASKPGNLEDMEDPATGGSGGD